MITEPRYQQLWVEPHHGPWPGDGCVREAFGVGKGQDNAGWMQRPDQGSAAWGARYAHVFADPVAIIVARADILEIWLRSPRRWQLVSRAAVDTLAARFRALLGWPHPRRFGPQARHRTPEETAVPGFTGGLIGIFGYELGNLWEPLRQDVPYERLLRSRLQGAWLLVSSGVTRDQRTGEVWLWSRGIETPGGGADGVVARRQLGVLRERMSAAAAAASGQGLGNRRVWRLHRPRLGIRRSEYLRRVEEIKRRISRGECYQACLTFPLCLPSREFGELEAVDELDAVDDVVIGREALFADVGQDAPFASWLGFRLPSEGSEERLDVVSGSLERFLRVERGVIEISPMKGTRPRGNTPDADEKNRAALARSAKDCAENVMIVDLVRHDLGRVCCPGSIAVPRLLEVEAHPTVFQMVSTVTGALRPDADALDALRAAFPPGSMTGAPRLRARQILADLEDWSRELYGGAFGYLGVDGSADSAVTIRTLVLGSLPGRQRPSWGYWGVGGGIVADSHPAAEWEEALLKGRRLLSLWPGPPLPPPRALRIIH
ncbi:MAG: anthranilate synthase component I family protein [Candidatus Schekmanbacteria bacterium]|nr:anthranilate synthase component I family protein [Candidatus Schekmanbacteria bacterium]